MQYTDYIKLLSVIYFLTENVNIHCCFRHVGKFYEKFPVDGFPYYKMERKHF